MPDPVKLRPTREDDLPLLERLTNDPDGAGSFQWLGWHDPGQLPRRWKENGLLGPEHGQLMISQGDAAHGFVSWHKVQTGQWASCWNIGLIIRPEARGQGIGTEAQRLLAHYLFAHTLVNRVEADTEVENIAEQRALEKAGFTREGLQRGWDFRDGQWRDSYRYSFVRSDLP